MSPPASAQTNLRPIAISAGPLSHTLIEIARQTNVEVLFDADAVAGKHAQAIKGRFTPMAALQAALAGTKLSFSFASITQRRSSCTASPSCEISCPHSL